MTANILFLYNYTDFAPWPWAEAGYRCFCFDQKFHSKTLHTFFDNDGVIYRLPGDLHDPLTVSLLFSSLNPKFVVAFPVCTQLSFVGTRHWKDKEAKDRDFLIKAAYPAMQIEEECKKYNIPFMVENPRGALSWIWREADYEFDPCDYGGYLPLDDENPLAPKILAPRDAYKKKDSALDFNKLCDAYSKTSSINRFCLFTRKTHCRPVRPTWREK